MPDRKPVGFGRRDAPPDVRRAEPGRALPGRRHEARRRHRRGAHPGAAGPRPQGLVREAARHRRLARLRRRGAARLPRGRSGGGRARHPGRARIAPAAVRGQGRRGDDDGAARGRRRGDRPGAGAGPDPRPRARRDRRRSGPATRTRHHRARPLAARGHGRDRRRLDRARRRGAPVDGHDRRLVGGRAAVGGPDPARRRVRPAARRQRRPSRRRRRPGRRRRRPAGGGPRRRGHLAVRGRAQGRAHGHRRARRLAPRSPRSRTRRWPRAGRATSWPARSGRSSPRAWTRSPPPALGVYLHGMAGDAGRERFGDAGLLASDLPDGLASARKRLAVVAERRTASKRLGFAALGGSPAGSPVPRRRPRRRTGCTGRAAAGRPGRRSGGRRAVRTVLTQRRPR